MSICAKPGSEQNIGVCAVHTLTVAELAETVIVNPGAGVPGCVLTVPRDESQLTTPAAHSIASVTGALSHQRLINCLHEAM